MSLSSRTPVTNHARHERQILDIIDGPRPLTQRRLASDLGIALGLTNLLLRRLARKGWIRVKHVSPRRIRYLITPAGMAAKARLTREYFVESLHFYRESRNRMRERLAAMSMDMPDSSSRGGQRVVFFGMGPDAEVAYVCLQETPVELFGVVDAEATGRFFHLPVLPPTELAGLSLRGEPFARLIVMPLQDQLQVQAQLEARKVPMESVFWL
jgi:DNA-binding MarR family transcriptional regulator